MATSTGGLCGCLLEPFNKGMAFVLTTAVIWVLASFLVQDIDEDLGAFTLTYIANSMFSLYLPITAMCLWWQSQRHHSGTSYNEMDLETRETDMTNTPGPEGAMSESDNEATSLVGGIDMHTNQPGAEQPKRNSVLNAACVVAPLWFMAQLTFNAALSLTTVTSNTVLSSASSMFTYLGSVLFLGEKYKTHKLLSVMLCMAGTIFVALADQRVSPAPPSPSDSSAISGGSMLAPAQAASKNVIGDLLTLTSSGFYAAYTIAISYYMPSDEGLAMSRFFGYMGLCIMLTMAPVVLFLQINGVVQMQHVKAVTYQWTLVKGLFDNVLTDYLWARAVVLLGPTVATLGLSMQIPVALVLDLLLGRATFASSPRALAMNMLSVVFVVAGFIGINMNQIPWLDRAVAQVARLAGISPLNGPLPSSLRD